MKTLIFLEIILLFVGCLEANLHGDHPLKNRLRTWDTITEDDIYLHRPKRSINDKSLDKKVTIKAFNRRFTLSLVSSPEIFAPDFHASVHNRKGSQQVRLDQSSLYRGAVVGEPGSVVQAHLEDKSLMASIKMKEETYIVEPAWRHLPGETPEQHRKKSKMIVYRQSDLNMTKFVNAHQKDGYCGVESIMKDINSHKNEFRHQHNESTAEQTSKSVHGHRQKRATGTKNKICDLALVADYRFYQNMGNNDYLQTMYYLINLIDRVNQIFKATNWKPSVDTDEYKGYGFQISSINVYQESTNDPSYNSDRKKWTAKELLEEFSKTNHRHCLAHLFTYIDFEKGVLGLAYVGASKADDVGGICTDEYVRGQAKKTLYLNTGLTTTLNWNTRILTLEADLVTTHELGHNFGAEHDNGETEECSPGESNNGNFIMYPAAVSGANPNNKLFSICSKRNILRCLEAKATKCFKEHKAFFCGNYKVEEGEECDAGYEGADRCCTIDCKLQKHAACSNKNFACCNDECQAANNSTLCYSEVPESCLRNTYCDGKNFECPQHLHKKDNESCGDNGKCKAGICQPFCNTVGMKPCLCTDKKQHFCLRCCAPKDSFGEEMIAQCKPYYNESSTIRLRNNARCTLGYCEEGECIKQTQDVIERVWSIFEHIAPDKIGEFLADNIVGAVLVFSLLFWVPCGCLVNFVDKKREKQRRNEEQWFTEKGSDFSRPNAHGGMFGSSNTLHKVNKPTRGGNMAMRAGLNAQDQWRQSQERGLAARRKSQENIASDKNGQTSAFLSREPLGRGDGAIINVSNSQGYGQSMGQEPSFSRNIVEAQNGEGYARSNWSGGARPQLRRQQVAIEEEISP